jgi:hypothetical protein
LWLEDRSSTQLKQSSTWDQERSTSSSLLRRYTVISIVIQLMDNQRRIDQGGDVVQPNTTRISFWMMKKKNLWRTSPQHQSQLHQLNSMEGEGIIIQFTVTKRFNQGRLSGLVMHPRKTKQDKKSCSKDFNHWTLVGR